MVNIPKEFYVERESSHKYEEYIQYLNDRFHLAWHGTIHKYYGVMNTSQTCSSDLSNFTGAKKFTAKEFMSLLNNEQTFHEVW